MKTQTILVLLLISVKLFSQNIINGKVTGADGTPLPGVNIFIEGTYDGSSSDENGYFQFRTSKNGLKTIAASYIGYVTTKKEIIITDSTYTDIKLRESLNTLDAVTITAGSFAASDEKRAAILETLDILTTASANGDVIAAIRTMPGTQAAADDGRLMVRGGDAYESKTFIDGLLTVKPYYSKTPDIATRGRFSPSLFTGVMFNSGGYSAEYGQALSSVLILNSSDVSPIDVTGLSIMTIGGEANITRSFKNSSFMMSAGYTNLALYDLIFNSSVNWTKPVESAVFNGSFKIKPTKRGLLKGYLNADWGKVGYETPDGGNNILGIKNETITTYSNFSYSDCFSEKVCYRIGLASTYENDDISLNQNKINNEELSIEGRATVIADISDGIKISGGISDTYDDYNQTIVYDSINPEIILNVEDHILGAFIESEIKFNKNFAIRPGIRSEYSTLIEKYNISPRFSVALKTGKKSQISAAWGNYFQNPGNEYLKLNKDLDFEKSTHYILGFQTGSVDKKLFRTELYYKNYKNLTTWEGNNEYYPQNIKNEGKGYAAGIDLFWRDKETFKHLDYWVTYSYIDTKRKYKNYKETVTPDFISDHTFSFVSKYWINKINSLVGLSFTAASPRPYDDPNTQEFMDKKTKWYTDLSLNISHIFYIGDQYSVLYCSVTNVLGRDNVFGYRPSGVSDAQGNYSLIPIKQDLKRFIFVGLFLSF